MSAGRPVGSSSASTKRALAIRLAIEARIKKSMPEKMLDLIENMSPYDQFAAYATLLPYCYPKLQVQCVVDADEMGLGKDQQVAEKNEKFIELEKAKLELKCG